MQIVGYETAPDGALVLAAEGELEQVELEPGSQVAYGLGERHCAGVVRDGRHVHCSNGQAPRCSIHAERWHEGMIADREDEHVIYLAAFAPAEFKVGVTRTWRLETRLLEQGADRGAHILTVADGQAAREIETALGTSIGERVRVATKIAGLHREVDEAAWQRLLDDFEVVESFVLDYGFALDTHPVPETLASGTVIGIQGRVLVLENAGTRYAVDLRDLVGYTVAAGQSCVARQSSLDAFDRSTE